MMAAAPVGAENRTSVGFVGANPSSSTSQLLYHRSTALVSTASHFAGHRAHRRPRKGMMIAGWTVLGVSYLIAFTIGWTAYDSANFWAKSRYGTGHPLYPNELKRIKNYGRYLMIPAIGPFLSTRHARTGIGRVSTGFLGTVEIAGLVLGILGTVRYHRSKALQQYPQMSWQFGQEYRGVSIRWKF